MVKGNSSPSTGLLERFTARLGSGFDLRLPSDSALAIGTIHGIRDRRIAAYYPHAVDALLAPRRELPIVSLDPLAFVSVFPPSRTTRGLSPHKLKPYPKLNMATGHAGRTFCALLAPETCYI